MLRDNDTFDRTANKMIKYAIIANIIIYGLVAVFIILLLYLIKVWFFGGF